MSRPRYVELPSVSAVREARLRLEHVFALGPPTSFGSAPPEIPASELFAAVPHTDAPSPRPTVISRALLSKGGGGDGGGDDKRRGQKSQSSMQLTSASARGVVLVGAPPSAEAVDEVISIVGQHAAVGGAAAVSATKAASGVALACGGGAVGAVVPVCAKLPELVGTVGLKVTRNLFALYLLVTVIEAPERAEEQLARIGGASRDLVTAPSRPSGNTLRGSAPVPNLLRPLKLPIPVPSILLPPPNVPPSAPTDSLYNLFGFIDLFSVWRAVWRVGDYFEGAFELLSEKVNIDVNCPGAYSAWYPLTNSALIFALLLLFQSDLLLYCRITILKFGRGRNAVFKYAVGNFSYFAYESALVLEQLAVASWSLRLYHYGWIRKHREEAIGGLDSACNDESNGADVTLFHLVTNMVAWLMAPFQLYMLVNWGVPHNGCYRGFYGSFLFGGVAFQKRGLQGAAKIVGLRDGGPWARAAERYYDKASSGFHRGLAACTRPVARAADAYLKLGEAASTIPSRVKSMCGVWDKGHFVTMEVVADAAAFDDEDEDEDAHFEECPELARLPLLASVRTDIYAVLGWQLRRLNLGRVRPFFCATALSLRMADELSARFVSKGAIHRHRRLLLLLFICALKPADATTTLESEIAASYTCYDPAGASCSCTSIELNSQSLTGSIPAELSACTTLTLLSSRVNDLTGTLPVELSTLTSLTTLSVYENSLSGTVPAEYSTMTSLGVVKFYDNSLTGSVPAAWSTMTSLTILQAHYNSFTGSLPDEWSTMISLETIKFYYNSLSGSVPAEYSTMTSLNSLNIYGNSLSGVVPSVWCDAAPATCDLVYAGTNEFWCTSICDNGNYPCDLTTSLCVTLSTLEYKLTDTYGSCYDPSGASCSCSGALALSSQSLTGSIPAELSACTGLITLELDENSLTGTIPKEWSTLTSLETVKINSNSLTGTLPAQFSTLTSLWRLKLQNNDLTGSLPIDLSTWTSLTQLNLCCNDLTGKIHSELSALTSLTKM